MIPLRLPLNSLTLAKWITISNYSHCKFRISFVCVLHRISFKLFLLGLFSFMNSVSIIILDRYDFLLEIILFERELFMEQTRFFSFSKLGDGRKSHRSGSSKLGTLTFAPIYILCRVLDALGWAHGSCLWLWERKNRIYKPHHFWQPRQITVTLQSLDLC